MLISAIVLYGIFKKEDIPSDKFDKLYIYSFIGIFAGARLGSGSSDEFFFSDEF